MHKKKFPQNGKKEAISKTIRVSVTFYYILYFLHMTIPELITLLRSSTHHKKIIQTLTYYDDTHT